MAKRKPIVFRRLAGERRTDGGYVVAFAMTAFAQALADFFPKPRSVEEIPSDLKKHVARVARTPLSPSEQARLAKIRLPNSRYRPRALGPHDIIAMQTVDCCGEKHRIAVLKTGELTPLDHPRQTFRLEVWAKKSARIPLDGCAEAMKQAQGVRYSGLIYQARELMQKPVGRGSRGRAERHAPYVEAPPAKFIDRVRKQALELATHTLAPFGVDRFNNGDWYAGKPRLTKRRRGSYEVSMDAMRWYLDVYRKGWHACMNGVVIGILDFDENGRPSCVDIVKKGEGGTVLVRAGVSWASGKPRLARNSYDRTSR